MAGRSRRRRARCRPPKDQVQGAEAIRAKVAAGRTKSALRDANLLAKTEPGSESDALLAEVYAARLEALGSAQMAREVDELLDVASRRFPELRSRWTELRASTALQTGDLGPVLRAWREADRDDAGRAEIKQQLMQHCADPARIATAGELAEDEPLRSAARAVQQAFEEAADGALSDAARAALRQVPRRSPLAPWREFVLALAAFHAGEDAEVLRHLERIPESAAPHRLGELLRVVVAGTSIEPSPSPRERALLAAVTGGRMPVLEALPALEQALDSRCAEDVEREVRKLAAALSRCDRRLALRFGRWVLRNDIPYGDTAVPMTNLFGDEWNRLAALESAADDPLEPTMNWLTWLLPGLGESMRVLGDAELALVLEQMAAPADAVTEDLLHTLRMAGVPVESSAVLAESDARAVAEAALDCDEFDEDLAVLGSFCFLQARVLDQLRERCPAVSIPPPTPGLTFMSYACVLDATSARWVKLYAQYSSYWNQQCGTSQRQRKALLEWWANQLPSDIEPLLTLFRLAESRSSHRQAESYLRRAEVIAPIDERLRAARFRLLLARLHGHIRQRKQHLCEQDLAALAAAPSSRGPERSVYLEAARCRVAAMDGVTAERAAFAELEGAVGNEALALALLEFVDGLVNGWGDAVVVPDRLGPVERVRLLVRLLAVAAAVLADDESIGFIVSLADVGPCDLPSEPRDLALLCVYLEQIGDADLLHACSGAGLGGDGMLLPCFLAYRWCALCRTSAWGKDAGEVGRAALQLAYRWQDHDTVRRILGGRLGRLADDKPMPSERVQQILARERCSRGRLRKRRSELRPKAQAKAKAKAQAKAKAKAQTKAQAKAQARARQRKGETPLLPLFEATEEA